MFPVPPGVKQLSYYLDGARRHEALEKLYSANDPAHIVSEKKGVFEDVSFSIDLYFDMPIEFKTTRAREAIPEHWIRQLAYYMLATDSDVGILQIQRIVPKDEDSIFPSYLVEFTNEEQRIGWLEEFRNRKETFRMALDSSMPEWAPIYRGENSWLCRQCPYKSRCDEIEQTK
ncbi:MAG: PD-(D/E)XK nuclease family protein [Nitrososphaerales archaeon]